VTCKDKASYGSSPPFICWHISAQWCWHNFSKVSPIVISYGGFSSELFFENCFWEILFVDTLASLRVYAATNIFSESLKSELATKSTIWNDSRADFLEFVPASLRVYAQLSSFFYFFYSQKPACYKFPTCSKSLELTFEYLCQRHCACMLLPTRLLPWFLAACLGCICSYIHICEYECGWDLNMPPEIRATNALK